MIRNGVTMPDRVPLEQAVDSVSPEVKIAEEAKATKVPEYMAISEEDALLMNSDFRRLTDFLGMDSDTARENMDELLFLLDWGKEKAKSEDSVEAVYALKNLKDSIGFKEDGKTALSKLYSYIRLSDEQGKLFDRIKRIKKERELLTNG